MKQNIIDTFQLEFKRLLTPLEQETIDDWRKLGYNDEQIREALKESVLSGTLNFRYMTKILKSMTPNSATNEEQDTSWLE